MNPDQYVNPQLPVMIVWCPIHKEPRHVRKEIFGCSKCHMIYKSKENLTPLRLVKPIILRNQRELDKVSPGLYLIKRIHGYETFTIFDQNQRIHRLKVNGKYRVYEVIE